jgi:hypothetical protein
VTHERVVCLREQAMRQFPLIGRRNRWRFSSADVARAVVVQRMWRGSRIRRRDMFTVLSDPAMQLDWSRLARCRARLKELAEAKRLGIAAPPKSAVVAVLRRSTGGSISVAAPSSVLRIAGASPASSPRKNGQFTFVASTTNNNNNNNTNNVLGTTTSGTTGSPATETTPSTTLSTSSTITTSGSNGSESGHVSRASVSDHRFMHEDELREIARGHRSRLSVQGKPAQAAALALLGITIGGTEPDAPRVASTSITAAHSSPSTTSPVS